MDTTASNDNADDLPGTWTAIGDASRKVVDDLRMKAADAEAPASCYRPVMAECATRGGTVAGRGR